MKVKSLPQVVLKRETSGPTLAGSKVIQLRDRLRHAPYRLPLRSPRRKS
jgi:hypothetical protein